jgi:predicted DsbA family dithiol-disulfide isomerase
VRADRIEREYAVQVTWEPYELHPETPPEGRPRPARVRPSPVEAAAHAAGLEMTSPPIIANSRPALEASEFVRDQAPEAFSRFHHGVFRAYFVDGRNIGDPAVLAAVGSASGVDPAALRAAIAARAYRDLVTDKIAWAVANGLASTPTFLFDDRFQVVGAQEYAFFELVLNRFDVPRLGAGLAGELTAFPAGVERNAGDDQRQIEQTDDPVD